MSSFCFGDGGWVDIGGATKVAQLEKNGVEVLCLRR